MTVTFQKESSSTSQLATTEATSPATVTTSFSSLLLSGLEEVSFDAIVPGMPDAALDGEERALVSNIEVLSLSLTLIDPDESHADGRGSSDVNLGSYLLVDGLCVFGVNSPFGGNITYDVVHVALSEIFVMYRSVTIGVLHSSPSPAT